MSPELRARLIAWRRAELELTRLVAHMRRHWPDPSHALCDALLDRLDAIDGKLDHVGQVVEEVEMYFKEGSR